VTTDSGATDLEGARDDRFCLDPRRSVERDGFRNHCHHNGPKAAVCPGGTGQRRASSGIVFSIC
jgi:hypothetical protein